MRNAVPYNVGEEVKGVIRQLEGFESKSYDDLAKHPTIGYGHKILPGEDFRGRELTLEEGESLMEKDIKIHQDTWIGQLRPGTADHVVAGLTAFAYHVGPNAPVLLRVVDSINAGDIEGAIRDMSQYNKSTIKEELVEIPAFNTRRGFEGEYIRGNRPLWDDYSRKGEGILPKIKSFFGMKKSAAVGTSFSSATAGPQEMYNSNEIVLQGLRALNKNSRNVSHERQWAERIKAEGKGLWAAGM